MAHRCRPWALLRNLPALRSLSQSPLVESQTCHRDLQNGVRTGALLGSRLGLAVNFVFSKMEVITTSQHSLLWGNEEMSPKHIAMISGNNLTSIEHLRVMTCTSPHKNSTRKIISLFYKWENRGAEKLNNFSNVTQLIKVKTSNPDSKLDCRTSVLSENSAVSHC